MQSKLHKKFNISSIDDLKIFISVLPTRVQNFLSDHESSDDLIEVILDLGRPPEVRFPDSQEIIGARDVTSLEIQSVIKKVGEFGDDNRAGIERTLHRISVIKNRVGIPIGITCRVGRAIEGTIQNIQDLVTSGKSVLLLGKPGIGKTTMLREVARVLSMNASKRVIIVDTSNEIAGDGDVPHRAIGDSRRMQVPSTALQHQVMIEAVENHMPEIIIIDEMSTESESLAARTIAERGVQLIATAHANNLENVLTNPTLSDLVGGTQTVTLGDLEAKRRKTKKTILERKHDPTFPIVVEIVDRNKVSVHKDVAKTVDAILRGRKIQAEIRWIEKGQVKIQASEEVDVDFKNDSREKELIYPFGISKNSLKSIIKEQAVKMKVTDDTRKAKIFLTTKAHYSRKPNSIKDAENLGIPVHVIRKNTKEQIRKFLEKFQGKNTNNETFSEKNLFLSKAIEEVQDGISKLLDGESRIELSAQNSYVRRLQHKIAAKEGITSVSIGEGNLRRVVLNQGWQ